MTSKNNLSLKPGGREFVITRTFDAPRERVFKAWTDAERLMHWWGPKGFKVSVAKLDLRPGGMFHYCLLAPNGDEMWGKFAYREIVPPERLVFVNSFSDKDGGVTRHPLHQAWPLQMLSTITFAEENGKTAVTVRWVALSPTESERETFEQGFASMTQGWTGTFDQLEHYLQNAALAEREFVFMRIFDAPRKIVWKAWTDPAQVAQWWGPEGFTNPVCELDVRVGGGMNIHMRGPDGMVYPMTGTYQELVEPERLAFLSAVPDDKGGSLFEVLTTVTFTEKDGKTTQVLRAKVVKVSGDLAFQYLSGMEAGWTQSLVRLAAQVAKIGKGK